LWLRKKRWRQEDLAAAAGLSVGSVSRLESGYHRPQFKTIVKLAEALECEVDDLVPWHEE
jgi:transcriptional regulator with XRE-family HTH domain